MKTKYGLIQHFLVSKLVLFIYSLIIVLILFFLNLCLISDNNKNIIHDTNNFLPYVYKLLYNLNMHVSAYTQLCASYEFFLTLSVTEVNCERTFSKLKLVKTRLRANMSQDNLEALLIMFICCI
jgi:hypothetical protein